MIKDEIIEKSINKHYKGLSEKDERRIKMLTVYFIEHLMISAFRDSYTDKDIDKDLKETKELFFLNDKDKQSFEEVIEEVSKEFKSML